MTDWTTNANAMRTEALPGLVNAKAYLGGRGNERD